MINWIYVFGSLASTLLTGVMVIVAFRHFSTDKKSNDRSDYELNIKKELDNFKNYSYLSAKVQTLENKILAIEKNTDDDRSLQREQYNGIHQELKQIHEKINTHFEKLTLGKAK